MADPTEQPDVEQIRTEIRLEMHAEMRAQIAEVRAEAAVRELILALTPYLPSRGHLLPPLWVRRRAGIPTPRLSPEGVRHDRAPRPPRRRSR